MIRRFFMFIIPGLLGRIGGPLQRNILLCLTISVLVSTSAWGGQTGKVTGRITDAETGEPLPGANVLLEETSMGASTDLEGYYVILNVRPGTYDLKVSMMGYWGQMGEGLKVSLDVTTKMDFVLLPKVLEGEEVVVTARSPIVQRDLTASKQLVRGEDISQMPVENFTDALELQAGVIKDVEGRIHIRGGRASEVNYLIDGISVTDPFSGELSVEVELGGIEQFQVISGGFNAEYGQALSGVVELITKEGGQEYHGSVSTYVGDYLTSDSDLFFGTGDLRVSDITNLEASLNGPVPFFNKRLTFHVNGRYFSNKGWLYGQRRFTPQDLSSFEDANPDNWVIRDHTTLLPDSIVVGDSVIVLDSVIVGLDDYRAHAEKQEYTPVSMNPFKKLSLQAKLAFKISPTIKFSVGGLYNTSEFKQYSHRFLFNPDGIFNEFKNGLTITPILNHSLSSSTFYTAKFSYIFFEYDRYVFADALDPGYADPLLLEAARQNAFYTGGTAGVKSNQSDRDFIVHRETTTRVGKFDITSQVSKSHQIKSGVALKQYDLKYEEFEIVPEKDEAGRDKVPFRPAIPPVTSFNHNVYYRKPAEFSAYIQDKIELKEMVINLGLRLDYFDAKGRVPTDFRDPSLTQAIKTIDIYQGEGDILLIDPLHSDVPYRLNADDSRALIDPDTGEPFSKSVPSDARFIDAARSDLSHKDWAATASWFENTKALAQLSPRVGISYPITDRGAIYFSYGFFFQKPTTEQLYLNPEFEMNREQSGVVNTLIGNANLKNKKTVNYEIGLQQQFGMNTGFFVTVFYKDINNWIGSEIVETYIAGDRYGRFINLDYGNVRGITIALDLRPTRNVTSFIDYTFQIAAGNASNPEAVFSDASATPPRESEIQTVPLDWDQRHTLNLTTTLNDPAGNWGISVIGKLNTGKPYTPTLRAQKGVRASFENSERKPIHVNFDLKGTTNFKVGTYTLSLFLKVYNLFDARNVSTVFSSTGRADFTSDILFAGRVTGVNTLEEWYTRPDYYAEPRRVQMGLNIAF
ncbi:MAG: TonB-dependent receptor [Candidatus Marinimicrobia bacterium]|nr:TonB-dependent receptor [Candidatus Neomarinimicrobiota bacterium]